MAEFDSVVDAYRCAIGIQQELAKANAELPPEAQLRLRIGEPMTVPPHGALMVGDAKPRHGKAQTFKCWTCGARWERFRTFGAWLGAPQVWRML